MVADHIHATDLNKYGVWVYYPWSNNLVHLLDEDEFIKVRTNRNIYKILPEEIETLGKKKIGIIGLSVGQSIAMTLALERTCGELRLADFDDIELSNMNRIRAGVQDLGMSKVVLAARQIAELDPYIKVKCFKEGLTNENINGIGMDEEVKAKIFDPFYTTKDVGEGTGLGLSIAYQTVLKHQGEIIINSTPNEGAEFIVRLPIKQNNMTDEIN